MTSCLLKQLGESALMLDVCFYVENAPGRDLGRALLREDLTALSWNFLASSGFASESPRAPAPGPRYMVPVALI